VENNIMKNSEVVGKYVIVENLKFSDYMKDEQGNIKIYDTLEEASCVCGIYEFENVLILKVEYNHVEME
jgi:hypothetical protein